MLKQQIQRVEPNRKMNEVLLLQDNARPYTRLHTKEATTKTEWTVLPHPTYSPDLAPCNFHLLGLLNVSLQKCFADSNELEHSMCEELQCFSKEFYVTSIQHLMQRWKKCIDNKEDLVEKQSQHSKNICMIYVNLIIIVITVSVKKQEALLSYRPLYVMPLQANPLT
jgi:hypothetical protein